MHALHLQHPILHRQWQCTDACNICIIVALFTFSDRDILTVSIPARSLRHNKGTLLKVPRMKSKTGTRAFQSCAPTLWNSLPLTMHSANSSSTFWKLLKTHLFRLSSYTIISSKHRWPAEGQDQEMHQPEWNTDWQAPLNAEVS